MSNKSNQPINLSIIIPVHNEAEIIETAVKKFIEYFSHHAGITKFELWLCDNGSTDQTRLLGKQLSNKYRNVHFVSVKKRGLGLGLKQGIQKARYDFIYLDGIDNPFNFDDLKLMLPLINKFDLIFASKNNPRSIYQNHALRKLGSALFSYLTNLLFSLNISDTQGTITARREQLLRILPFCTSSGPFFQAQIAIFGKLNNFSITEVPVVYLGKSRKSKFSLIQDGLYFIFELLRQRIILYR